MSAIDALFHEMMLFAAIGFLIGGIDDLVIDCVHLWAGLCRRYSDRGWSDPVLADYPLAAEPLRIVVFVAAWDESTVIGAMLRSALGRFDHPDYALYVGAYPNDPATIAAIDAVVAADARVRKVICDRPGPTTKAHCLNQLWHALAADEAAGAARASAVMLHDAEDLVDAGELILVDHFLRRHAVVQLPVEPLVDRASRFVSGHYCDEFAEAHGKQLPVRDRLGAGLPLAGVGCAVGRAMLDAIAMSRGGEPFDEASLTEDYELGLMIAAMGGRGAFVRVRAATGAPFVAVRAYFPARLHAAVRQKARWMVGIALAGWDRTGWAPVRHWPDHWMRMRDRRAIAAVFVLTAAYAALILWAVARTSHALAGTAPPPIDPGLEALLSINAVLLIWRLAVRAWFVGRIYGVGEALRSVPRTFVANLISLLAARQAMLRYVAMLAGARPRWDKTAHHFPDTVHEAPQ